MFFADVVGLSPVAVHVLLAGQPVMIGLLSVLGQRLSAVIGTSITNSLAKQTAVCRLYPRGIQPERKRRKQCSTSVTEVS